jgi:hypothetical protein
MTIQISTELLLTDYRSGHIPQHVIESGDDQFTFDYPLEDDESTLNSFLSDDDDDDSTIISLDLDFEDLEVPWMHDVDFPSSKTSRTRQGRRPTRDRLEEMRQSLERDMQRLMHIRAERLGVTEEDVQKTYIGQLRIESMDRVFRQVERMESPDDGDSLRLNRRRIPRTTTRAYEGLVDCDERSFDGEFEDFVVDLNDTVR